MLRFEAVLDEHHPRCVLVVGDVNSTLACTLVAVKKDVPVVHVEAGLRSFDRKMPEEINRKLTDQVADRLYTTERSAGDNLLHEGIAESRICFAGNVMIDSLLAARPKAPEPRVVLQAMPDLPAHWQQGLTRFGVVTLHRPSNVDSPEALRQLLQTLRLAAQRLPLVFALHPRTRENIRRFELQSELDPDRILLMPPQGLSGNARADVSRHGGVDRLRWAPGRKHGVGRSVPHLARQHRAAHHARAGYQQPGRTGIAS